VARASIARPDCKDFNVTRTALRAVSLVIGASFPLIGSAQNAVADRASVEAFFAKYVKLESSFDVKLADLYSDRAWIYVGSLSADGLTVKNMRFPGSEWKVLLPKLLPLARKTEDRDTFSNLRITTEGSKAKIEADRYSVGKCYTDRKYSMRVERQSDGSYLIMEERARGQDKSSC
jgi:hypothetical protein